MITLTPAALSHIEKIISMQPEPSVFRLSVKNSGCSGWRYVPKILSEPVAGDIILTLSGVRVCLDPDAMEVLRGTTLDLVDRGMGQKQLLFNNPNAVNHCGCGESFSLKEHPDGKK